MAGLGASSPSSSNTNLGDVTVTTDPLVSGVSKLAHGDKLDGFTFSAGAYRAKIWVKTFGATIIVNGDSVVHGGNVWTAEYDEDKVNGVQDFLSQISVQAAADVEWSYNLQYPSASSVDVSAL